MATVVLVRGKEQRVYGGHPWVFRSDIQRVEGADAEGRVVRVLSDRGQFLAMAVYNPQSQIALRILTRKEEAVDRAFIQGRVQRALAYRRRFADLTSCRLLFAESDGLPAVIADAFGDVIVMQVLCRGMEPFKQDIVDALVAELHPRGVYERNDVPVRTLEGLPMQTGLLYGIVPDRVEMVENGVRFLVDVKEGKRRVSFWIRRRTAPPSRRLRRARGCWTALPTPAALPCTRPVTAPRRLRAWISVKTPAPSRRITPA